MSMLAATGPKFKIAFAPHLSLAAGRRPEIPRYFRQKLTLRGSRETPPFPVMRIRRAARTLAAVSWLTLLPLAGSASAADPSHRHGPTAAKPTTKPKNKKPAAKPALSRKPGSKRGEP